ncbi:protoporphyrinogen oxidase [Frankia sp. CNm7]|uniref:Coproporphyrinogen III oxidase n=1 Tax=Frankia nepalensis TaxID=1836974 RepID=A0A937RJB6_9ACTN|nr:protoporphyrinogen oxidase [Frankia nepalensis]MBL7499329.1 protoporphyrinogen oxidase [Frankia nepalensis]MBL7514960.1 protoporphyrinogen oxidase [Frankia nepalensis]MBL7517720.1 protoporphyrinogen oxidase [Frankia nepalensis]MBL7629899.1 protoporphyrinogen oxidase [Frankia nepalensis]
MRVVIVGGGIAGLAAAHALAGKAEVTVLEAGARVGGKLRTTPFEGLDLEEGAESFLARVPEGQRLARQVGLGHDIVHPATTSASLWINGRLRPIPPNTLLGVPTDALGLVRSRVLSPRGLLRAAADLALPRTKLPDDPTVGEYVGARVGRQIVDRLVDPLLGGVYAGRADALSLRATVPQLVPILAEDRSLLLGAHRVRARTAPVAATGPSPVFATVRGGLGTFAARVAEASGATVRTGMIARRLARVEGGWRVDVDEAGAAGDIGAVVTGPRGNASLDADAVILAVPAGVARDLLTPIAPHAAAPLAGVPYASIGLVTLVYRDVDLPAGSGFLVPARERATIKAATYLSAKWPHVSAGGPLRVVRASVGRAGAEQDLRRSDVELAGVVAAEIAHATGLSARPVASRVSRWGGGLPQYLPGHLERVAMVRRALPPGLALAGAGYDGVGIPACIRSGEAAAEAVLGAVDDAVVGSVAARRGPREELSQQHASREEE